MYAIICTGGKQYKVEAGDIINIEKLNSQVGDQISFDVLMLCDGDKISVGQPYVKEASVTGEVCSHGKDKKVVVFKYKPKKNYRKKQGHRQPYTQVKILEVK